jgi:hypothetical protein
VAESFRETVSKIECDDVSSFNGTENETEWGKGELSKVTVCENKQAPETTGTEPGNCHNGFVGKPIRARNCVDANAAAKQTERPVVTFPDQTTSNSCRIVFVLTVL